LRQLEQDKLDAKYEIRQVLDRYRDKYRISAKQVNEAVWGYVDDLLSDFFYEKEEALKAEIEDDIERENQRPSSGRHEPFRCRKIASPADATRRHA
jgi:hypothetical protein